ncbi:JAB domain-containing protein [Roseimaritima sediminicola]|uniref:JAB domain-containing protein n=1 Tax=Roseimaritima sediminicola TaxID=2662066 RepID=UPI0036F2270B
MRLIEPFGLCQYEVVKEKSDQELLSIVLRKQFCRVAGRSFREIVQAGKSELGLTDIAYARLMAGIELGKRVSEPKANYNVKITSTSLATHFCSTHFARLIAEGLQEEFHIVTLDTKHRMIDSHRISVGTLDASLVHPREVFRPAIKDASSAILLAHNHPSGDPTPSREDHMVTDRLMEAGKMIGITVLDHIVLAREGCVSVRELA